MSKHGKAANIKLPPLTTTVTLSTGHDEIPAVNSERYHEVVLGTILERENFRARGARRGTVEAKRELCSASASRAAYAVNMMPCQLTRDLEPQNFR